MKPGGGNHHTKLSYQKLINFLSKNPDDLHIIIDDICDSGKTLQIIDGMLFNHFQRKISLLFTSLIWNEEQPFSVDIFGHSIKRSEQPKWYQFFWEDCFQLPVSSSELSFGKTTMIDIDKYFVP